MKIPEKFLAHWKNVESIFNTKLCLAYCNNIDQSKQQSVCPPSVLKYVIGYFPFSPIPQYQDECLAVFSCCHNYIAEEIIVCVKRVAVCDKQMLITEIFRHGIGNRTEWNRK